MLNVIIDRKSANDYALMETESVVEEDLHRPVEKLLSLTDQMLSHSS